MPVFGVARRYAKDVNSFLRKLHDNSVEAYEIGFVYGVQDHFSADTKRIAGELGIRLSAHLPFFISWADEEKIQKSIAHISRGIRFASELESIAVCHIGHYGGRSFRELKPTIIKAVNEALELAEKHSQVTGPVLGIETTGRKSEIGTVDEVLSIVEDLTPNIAVPVIDWAHLFARSGGVFPRTVEDFQKVLTRVEKKLGIKNFHMHGSGMDHQDGQEKRHLTVKSCRPPLPYLLHALDEGGYDYTLIVESPSAIEDLIWLREVSKNPQSWFEFVQRQTSPLEKWMST